MRGTATHSTVERLREIVAEYQSGEELKRLVLFVDYLQKVPVLPEPRDEEEKVTRSRRTAADRTTSTWSTRSSSSTAASIRPDASARRS